MPEKGHCESSEQLRTSTRRGQVQRRLAKEPSQRKQQTDRQPDKQTATTITGRRMEE